MRSTVVVCVCVLAAAAPAAAQSTYVGASLMGEFSRFSGLDVDDDDGRIPAGAGSRNGDTIGFDIRVGRAIDQRWGIEFEFARGGVNEQRRTERVLAANGQTTVTIPGLPGLTRFLPVAPTFPIPEFGFDLEMEQRHTTFSPTAWVRQDIGDRLALAFSGGVSFSRVETEQTLRINDNRLAIFAPFPTEIESVDYGVGAVVGAEAMFDVGDHAAVTGGLRLHSVSGGWLIRPAIGLRWTF
jgi:opacity protein-like surface antigen